MSDIIRLLPDSVANQIAAGEVIQRPASVIKELVENSIDAGGTSVTIVLRDAGRTLIQVIDNGSGMSDTDARLAFERHATSKIRQADDLFALHTMGFRGEALASIAAIAQIELRTMLHGAQMGTRLVINGSKVESQEPEATVEGSNMMVKNLFFNVPARRKFLKKDAVEMAAIMREFERLALVNTGVDFTLISNDVTLHSLRRGPMKRRITDLFGKNLDKTLIPVETDTTIVKLSGFIGLPANARKRNPLQYLMVNGRNMRHPVFHKAIMQCYERLIPADEQPNYFISLTVDPDTIDVNIHPTKNEIKFENEAGIRQILVAAVRDSLGRFNAGPAIDFDQLDAPEIPVFNPDEKATHDVDIDPGYNPFTGPVYNPAMPDAWSPFSPDNAVPPINPDAPDTPAGAAQGGQGGQQRASRASRVSKFDDWEKLYDDFMRKRDEGLAAVSGLDLSTPLTADEEQSGGVLAGTLEGTPGAAAAIQLKGGYILTPTKGGVMVIDQHRAHYRILYDSFLAAAGSRTFVAQRAMFPDTLTLSTAQHAVMSVIADSLLRMGFEMVNTDSTIWSIEAAPSVLDNASPRDVLLDIIDSVAETGEDVTDRLAERLAGAMARSRAIRRNTPLTADQMDHLISDLLRLPGPGLTPNGKPTFTVITTDTLTTLLNG